jgi:hypothetical protein
MPNYLAHVKKAKNIEVELCIIALQRQAFILIDFPLPCSEEEFEKSLQQRSPTAKSYYFIYSSFTYYLLEEYKEAYRRIRENEKVEVGTKGILSFFSFLFFSFFFKERDKEVFFF